MLLNFRKGTILMAGSQPIELPADTELDVVGVQNYDEAAAALSGASHTIYGTHLSQLAHTETVQRDVNGVFCDVDLEVTYAAHGARSEKIVREPRPVQAEPVFAPEAIGAERVDAPAASDAAAQHDVNVTAAGGTSVPSPVEPQPDELPPNFPGYAHLVAAGFSKRSELEGATIEQLEKIPGVVPVMSGQIYAQLHEPLTEEEAQAIREQSAREAETAAAAITAAEQSQPAIGFVGNENRIFADPNYRGPERRIAGRAPIPDAGDSEGERADRAAVSAEAYTGEERRLAVDPDYTGSERRGFAPPETVN